MQTWCMLGAQYNVVFYDWQEMIYVWNGFAIIGRSPELLEPMSQVIENSINALLQQKGDATVTTTLPVVRNTIYWNKLSYGNMVMLIIYYAFLEIQYIILDIDLTFLSLEMYCIPTAAYSSVV